MEKSFFVVCLRDEEIVHIEETELVGLRGNSLERLGADGYLESIAAYDPGPRSWYGYDNCDRYDKITITLPPTRRLLVDLLDSENRLISRRELGGTRGLRLDADGGPRLMFINDDDDFSDTHSDPKAGLWLPAVDTRLGFDNLRFRTASLFDCSVKVGSRLRPSILAERRGS